MNVLILLLALAAPLVLLPIEKMAPYPHILEELVKAILVVWLVRGEPKRSPPQWLMAIGIGGLFALSETILYLNNFLTLANSSDLLPRLLLTGGLHIGTSLLLYASFRRGWILGILGLGLAIIVHYFFNLNLGLEL